MVLYHLQSTVNYPDCQDYLLVSLMLYDRHQLYFALLPIIQENTDELLQKAYNIIRKLIRLQYYT